MISATIPRKAKNERVAKLTEPQPKSHESPDPDGTEGGPECQVRAVPSSQAGMEMGVQVGGAFAITWGAGARAREGERPRGAVQSCGCLGESGDVTQFLGSAQAGGHPLCSFNRESWGAYKEGLEYKWYLNSHNRGDGVGGREHKINARRAHIIKVRRRQLWSEKSASGLMPQESVQGAVTAGNVRDPPTRQLRRAQATDGRIRQAERMVARAKATSFSGKSSTTNELLGGRSQIKMSSTSIGEFQKRHGIMLITCSCAGVADGTPPKMTRGRKHGIGRGGKEEKVLGVGVRERHIGIHTRPRKKNHAMRLRAPP